jgi:ferrous iron transport protein B
MKSGPDPIAVPRSPRKRDPSLVLALAGQPNCGKSTLFNETAGYHSVSANFPGATVSYTKGNVHLLGRTYALIDLPGVYSLTSLDPASRETQRYLLNRKVDAIVNVVDASVLSRSLELTLQLLELEIPMVLCLNMMDEAERKGIFIDAKKLGERLGLPVAVTVASKGRGVRELFWESLKAARRRQPGIHQAGSRDVENVIDKLRNLLERGMPGTAPFSKHLLATKLLENDPYFESVLSHENKSLIPEVRRLRRGLERSHGRSSDEVIGAERHALSMAIAESVSEVKKPKIRPMDRLDDVLMHNVWGYLFLFLFLFLFFSVIFRAGVFLERPLIGAFDGLSAWLPSVIPKESAAFALVKGAMLGLGGGIAIVVPYLVPFLLGFSFFEDLGYLPRVAFLLDAFMHRIGLHGSAVIPAVLGYGCNVPAVMATRILESPRDRFLATVVAILVPCSARMTVIFGLVGVTLGGRAALSIFVLNLIVVAATGSVLSRLLPEATPGMVMEIPPYRIPSARTLLVKTWLRLKDFVYYAWPLLILGSMVLGLVEFFRWTSSINAILSPLTGLLGIPRVLGIPLVFGLLRKELSMLMLFQALGTENAASVLSPQQIYIFTLFVVFYIPCLGTIGALLRQVGSKRTLAVILLSLFLSVGLGSLTRLVFRLF